MKKVAIFGGAFDPPHLGHALVITNLINSGLVDSVKIVPVGDGRDDKPVKATAGHRLSMLKIFVDSLFKGYPVEIDPVQTEGVLPLDSRTIDLIDYLKKQDRNTTYYFVIGADNIASIPSWKESERLLKEVKFICLPRPGEALPSPLPEWLTVLSGRDLPQSSISSSLIRDYCSSGKCIKALTVLEVEKYIGENCLYGTG